MNLTFEKILQLMDAQKRFCWSLFVVSGGYRTMLGNYKGVAQDTGDAASKKTKSIDAQESRQLLEHHVGFYRHIPNTIFEITLKSDPNSTNADMVGPIRFVDQLAVGDPANHNQQLNGFPQNLPSYMGGLGDLMPRTFMDDRLTVERERTELLVQKALLASDKARFEEEKARLLSELKVLEEKYNSQAERTQKGASMALGKFFDGFLDSQEKGKTLAGAEAAAEAPTEESKIVEEIAQFVFDNVKDKAQLVWLRDNGIKQVVLALVKTEASA